MTSRRKAASWALIAGCLLVNGAMFRLRPRWQELRGLEGQLATLEAERAGAAELARQVAELSRLEAELEARGGGALAARAEPCEVGLALADLAARCGLALESTGPHVAGDAAPGAGREEPLAARLSRADPARQAVRWTARGDYVGLLAFREALPGLPGCPLVLELQVERVRAPLPGQPPLHIRLLLGA
jgi:hypothetical protein